MMKKAIAIINNHIQDVVKNKKTRYWYAEESQVVVVVIVEGEERNREKFCEKEENVL